MENLIRDTTKKLTECEASIAELKQLQKNHENSHLISDIQEQILELKNARTRAKRTRYLVGEVKDQLTNKADALSVILSVRTKFINEKLDREKAAQKARKLISSSRDLSDDIHEKSDELLENIQNLSQEFSEQVLTSKDLFEAKMELDYYDENDKT